MPRRILLLVTDLELGGTPIVVRELARRLRQAIPSLSIEVACLAGEGPVGVQIGNQGIRATALGAKSAADFRILPRLIALISDRQFDTVFSFLIHANALAAAASLFVGEVRWIQSIQTTQLWPRWHWWLQRIVHQPAELVVVPSLSAAEVAHDWAGIPGTKIRVIPNAVETGDFVSCAPSTVLNDARPFPILFLGRLDPVKDVPTLIQAVSQLHGLVHLHVYGEGADRARIERAVSDCSATDWVTLHGPADDARAVLSRAGILVLPSIAEGFGLVLIEAMAAGLAVVATDVPGIRDVVRAGDTGSLVPPGRSDLLAAAIRTLVENPALRERLVTAAKKDVVARFDWKIVLPMYLRLLEL